jgi:alkanesulfonate monooxygenase SsuD/methylene tetrahydromethanopterin reductase-like flavin-dependent oxidoreductase (luciferase family)
MRIGVGLPNTVPGADGRLLVDWARKAEETGRFSSLAVLDRVAYDSYEPFTSLAAAAAVTERVRLATMIAIGPLRSTGSLAKLAGSVAALSSNRLTLGLAVGARLDDYEASGTEHRNRGRRLTEQLAFLRGEWDDSKLGPVGADRRGLQILVGGQSGPAFTRMARYADGYAHGGGPPRAFARAAAAARAAWSDLGRPDEPVLWGQGYFALGDEDRGERYLRDYYAFTGPFAEKIAAGNLTSARAIRDFMRGYEEEGCDELVLLPTIPEPEQLDRLAEVLD